MSLLETPSTIADPYEAIATLSPRIVCVKADRSKFVHYAPKNLFKGFKDKTTVQSLCAQLPPNGEAWMFVTQAGRICMTCHAEASRTKAVVVDKPVLVPPPVVRDASGWRGGSILKESLYAGICKGCGLAYGIGDSVYWKPEAGCRHEACGQHPDGYVPTPMPSRYGGWCKACRKPYRVGDLVFWKAEQGCRHEACGPHSSSSASPTASPGARP
jgi:hypothetical protein